MAELGIEIQLFRTWADGYPEPRSGEWECGYGDWGRLYEAAFAFLEAKPEPRDWSTQEMRDVLYVLARDNETEHIAEELRIRQPELLVRITEAALIFGERDARWQLAEQIGQLGKAGGVEEKPFNVWHRMNTNTSAAALSCLWLNSVHPRQNIWP